MNVAIRAAGFSLMTMFVSCGVGARDLDTPIGKEFYRASLHVCDGDRDAWARDIREVMRGDGENPYFRWFVGE